MGQAGNVPPRSGKKGNSIRKNSGGEKTIHKPAHGEVTCINLACERNKKSIKCSLLKRLQRCPNCMTFIPKDGYIS